MKSSFFFSILIFSLWLPTSLHSQNKGKQSRLMETTENPIEISSFELRLKMDAFFLFFAGTVEEAADSIMLRSGEPTVHKQALLWKMYAIPAAQRSIMVQDPFAGMIDAAVLCLQMHDFFEQGVGGNLFGDQQAIAINAAKSLEEEIKILAETLSEDRDISQGEAILQEYIRENPLNSVYFNRKSTLPLLAKYLEVEKMGVAKIARDVARNVEELTGRLNVYTEQLPKQVRWQSEYLVYSMLEGQKIDSITSFAQSRTDTLIAYLDRLTRLAESSPGLIDQQRGLITGDLQGERAILLDAIRRERLEVFKALREERAIILTQLMSERATVLDQLSLERQAAFQQMDSLAYHSIDRSFQHADHILDKLFWRTVMLIAVLFCFGVISMLTFKHLFKK